MLIHAASLVPQKCSFENLPSRCAAAKKTLKIKRRKNIFPKKILKMEKWNFSLQNILESWENITGTFISQMVTNQSTSLSTCTPEFNSFFRRYSKQLKSLRQCFISLIDIRHSRVNCKFYLVLRTWLYGIPAVHAQTLLDRNLQVVQVFILFLSQSQVDVIHNFLSLIGDALNLTSGYTHAGLPAVKSHCIS